MLFVYLYLIFRFPDFWYVIVFLFFIHCNFSNDLQERVNKYSSLFTIIAVLIVIGTYFSDKRDLNRDITAALNIENRNNQIAIESIKSMEEGKEKQLPIRRFQFLYIKQYWHKNIDYLTDYCLTNYPVYLSNMETANRFIDMLWTAQQYTVETNNSIDEKGFNYARQGLYKMNNWISVDMGSLQKCYKRSLF